MTVIAIIAFLFCIFMAFTLYKDVVGTQPAGWREYLTTVGIAIGSLCGAITAIRALF